MNDQTQTITPPWLESFKPAPPKSGRFVKGQSGNPVGRPKGSKNQRTILLEQLQDAGQEITQIAIDKAKDGDLSAIALVLARIAPPLKAQAQTVTFAFNPKDTLVEQAGSVLDAIARGDMDPETGRALIGCISTLAGLKFEELTDRLAAVEDHLKGRML